MYRILRLIKITRLDPKHQHIIPNKNVKLKNEIKFIENSRENWVPRIDYFMTKEMDWFINFEESQSHLYRNWYIGFQIWIDDENQWGYLITGLRKRYMKQYYGMMRFRKGLVEDFAENLGVRLCNRKENGKGLGLKKFGFRE